MNSVTVKTTCDDEWTTDFNGTALEARDYFLGQWFNRGREEDKMVQVCWVKWSSPGQQDQIFADLNFQTILSQS